MGTGRGSGTVGKRRAWFEVISTLVVTGVAVTMLVFFLIDRSSLGLGGGSAACGDSCAPVPELDCLINGVHRENKCDSGDLPCLEAFCQLNPEICDPE